MKNSIKINLNDVESIRIIDNGRELDFGVIFIGRSENGEVVAGVIAEDGELYNISFAEDDQVEIVVEFKDNLAETPRESINLVADEGM